MSNQNYSSHHIQDDDTGLWPLSTRVLQKHQNLKLQGSDGHLNDYTLLLSRDRSSI